MGDKKSFTIDVPRPNESNVENIVAQMVVQQGIMSAKEERLIIVDKCMQICLSQRMKPNDAISEEWNHAVERCAELISGITHTVKGYLNYELPWDDKILLEKLRKGPRY